MTTGMKSKPRRSKSRKPVPKGFPRWLKPLLLLLGIGVLLVLGRLFHFEDRFRDLNYWIRSLHAWGPVVYIFLFAGGLVFALPGSAMTMIAGIFFKTPIAILTVTLGAALGTALTFLISRYFAREDLDRWASKSQRFRKLDKMTEKHGAWIVAMLRLMPLTPFSVLNYAFGLTRIKFWEYLFWSSLCTVPGTVFFVLSARALFRGVREHQAPWSLIAALVGLTLLLALVMAWVERRMEKPRASKKR
jgi:uncharacterized membrane protein YdjX (TVP38/TMEM64 family)